MKFPCSRSVRQSVVLSTLLVVLTARALGEDTPPAAETSPISVAETNSAASAGPVVEKKPDVAAEADTQKVLRAYLQLQEQMHAAIVAIEQNRQETSAATARNAEAIRERLQLIEQNLTQQRSEQMSSASNSHRLVLVLSSIFAGLGFLAVVVASWLQLRAMSRIAEVAASLPAVQTFPRHAERLELGDATPSAETQHTTERLRHLLQGMEARIKELEATALVADKGTTQNGAGTVGDKPALAESTEASENASRISVLLGKGQALLNLNEGERAVAAFDEVLAIDPHHTEALVKKGTALERLRRLEDAIACYDQAIAANESMTLAYLYKGGVYNQLERFNEALECYEQALRTQQKGEHAATNAS